MRAIVPDQSTNANAEVHIDKPTQDEELRAALIRAAKIEQATQARSRTSRQTVRASYAPAPTIRMPPAGATGKDGYAYEDLTCELPSDPLISLSARGLANAMGVSLEGVVDPNPTVESQAAALTPAAAFTPAAPFAPSAPVVSGETPTIEVTGKDPTATAIEATRSAEAAAAVAIAAAESGSVAAKSSRPMMRSAPARPSMTAPAPRPAVRSLTVPSPGARGAGSAPQASAAVAPRPTAPPLQPTSTPAPPPAAPSPVHSPAQSQPDTPVRSHAYTPPADSAPLPGPQAAVIGVGRVLRERYELQALLGRGGMASVYKAVDRDRVRLGLAECHVAVKIIEGHAKPSSKAALLQEFESAQRLSHPNVVNVFDIDQEGDVTFYSMELLSGARLSQVLRRVDGAILQRRFALAIIRDIGAAVAHAHSRGVVHGDLKPSNVMITHTGEVRVLDFGGHSMPTREPWVSDGDTEDYHQATPAYASCEQLERRRADPRDDIYALACLSYVLLSGRHPFDGLSSIEARARGMRARRPRGVPLWQWRILRRGLAWGREQHTLSLEDWLTKLGLGSAVPSLPPLQDLTAVTDAPPAWQQAAVWILPTLAFVISVWALESRAGIEIGRSLSVAVAGAQDALHGAWQAAVSLGSDATTEGTPHPAAATPPAPSARTPLAAPARAPSSRTAPSVVRAQTSVPPPATQPSAPALVASAAAPTTAHVTFAAESYVVARGDPAARIVIERAPGSRGDLSFLWWTESASAEPDVDYAALGVRSEHLLNGQDKLTVYVPIISNPLRHKSTQFRVALVDAASHRGEGGAPSARATVTIEGGS